MWLLGNGRTKQNATDLSLKVIFNPQNEEFSFIYSAYDMHFDKGIEMSYKTKKISKISECFGTSTGIYNGYSDFTQSVLTENGAC